MPILYNDPPSADERALARKKLALTSDPNDIAYRAIAGRNQNIPGGVLLNTSPNGTAANGAVRPPTTYETESHPPVAAPPVSPAEATSQYGVGPNRPWQMDRTDLSNQMNDIQSRLIREKYLAANGNGPKVTPEYNANMVNSIADLRSERGYLERANQPSPVPLSPSANAANARGLDANLNDQLMVQRSREQPGSPEYQRLTDAMARTGARAEGSPAAQMSGFFAGGGSPEVGAAYGRVDAAQGYAKRGLDATEGQIGLAKRSDEVAAAAGERSNLYRNMRLEDVGYNVGMHVAGHQADLANIQGIAQDYKNRLALANDPTTIGFMKQSREAQAAAELAKAKGTLATTGAGASADTMQSQRDVLAKKYTLDTTTDARVEKDLNDLATGFSSLEAGSFGGKSFGGAEDFALKAENFKNTVVTNLEKAVTEAPLAANEKAKEYLAALDRMAPVTAKTGKYEPNSPGSVGTALLTGGVSVGVANAPVNVRNRKRTTDALNDSRQRILKVIAQTGG